ncbi:MAG: efflux RND transporter periplasmic adaptor subunit [Thiomargarita sp.]|nr:efflux RND transporter periplasmic adaptor subunit [Thiomargarita sp.]
MLKHIKIITVFTLLTINVNLQAEEYYEVKLYDLKPSVTLSGTVIPKKEVSLSAQLAGRIKILAGEEGETFDEGTTLVAIDKRELLAKRRSAVAQWHQANSELRNADMQYQRQLRSPNSPDSAPGGMGLPNLIDQILTKPFSDIIGQSNSKLDRRSQLYSRGTKIDQARSQKWQTESQIEQIDAKLRDAVSLAPFNGVIIEKSVEIGDTVQPGQRLLKFADITNLQIEVDVPARLVRGLKKEQLVTARLDVLNNYIIAKVTQIFPVADIQRHTVKVKFDMLLDQNSEETKYVGPGQYAQIDIPDVRASKQELLLVIPKLTIINNGSLPSVCVIKSNNKYSRRIVRLGRTINPALIKQLNPALGDYITILSGLKAGDKVVLYGKC